MDLKERIARRQREYEGTDLVLDYRSISPASHPDEPENRGRALERLLDALEPVFEAELPENLYVHGRRGTGKTAVVRSLFAHLRHHVAGVSDRIVTSTRVPDAVVPEFVYVDAREATSEFRLYRAVLESVVEEDVPGGGVGTDELRERLVRTLGPSGRSAVVAVDHLCEPGTMPLSALSSAFEPVGDDGAWVGVGTEHPEGLSERPPRTLSLSPYEQHALEDVLSARASRGLTSTALSHGQLRTIASWADGDAHDALAILFGAATLAASDSGRGIEPADVEAAYDDVHPDGVPIGQVLALRENRQRTLRELIELDEPLAVDATAAAIAERPGVDLSAGTVERFLYELADWGILERVTVEGADGDQGRPPSRVEPRFPTLVFERLYDIEREGA